MTAAEVASRDCAAIRAGHSLPRGWRRSPTGRALLELALMVGLLVVIVMLIVALITILAEIPNLTAYQHRRPMRSGLMGPTTGILP